MIDGDIRFDEDYARFYEAYSGQRKLPPPVDARTLYQELPPIMQQKLRAAVGHGSMQGPGMAQAAALLRNMASAGEPACARMA